MLSQAKARQQSDRSSKQDKIEPLGAKSTPRMKPLSEEELFRLIQLCAYYLWENAGKPEGEEAKERFWCEAEMLQLHYDEAVSYHTVRPMIEKTR